MKNVLAIETSGSVCAVGLSLDGNRFLQSEHVQKMHNERLLPMLTALAESAGHTPPSLLPHLHAVAFGRGPGSFTGVRIAAAAAQAMALAAGARILRVSSSEVLAQRFLADSQSADPPGVVTSIRSRKDLHYLATWRNDGGAPVAELADRLYAASPDAEFQARFGHWPVAGEVPSWWQGAAPSLLLPDADALLSVALRSLDRGEDRDAAQGLPEYLEGDSPWRKVR